MGVDDCYPHPFPIANGQGRPHELRQMSETDVRGTGCPGVGTSRSAGEGALRRPLLPGARSNLAFPKKDGTVTALPIDQTFGVAQGTF